MVSVVLARNSDFIFCLFFCLGKISDDDCKTMPFNSSFMNKRRFFSRIDRVAHLVADGFGLATGGRVLTAGKMVVADRKDAMLGIYEGARDSVVCRLIYRKWNRSERRSEKVTRFVVPLSFGVTSLGNTVLYAMDYKNHKQTKRFLVDDIESFEPTRMKTRTPFEIQVKQIKDFCSRYVLI